jgi:hypothetical protein
MSVQRTFQNLLRTTPGPGETGWGSEVTNLLVDVIDWANAQPFSVKDAKYGAVGDGVTDDRDAIQAAFDDLGTRGNVLIIPPGTYMQRGAVNYDYLLLSGKSNCLILGYGATIKMTADSPAGVSFTSGIWIGAGSSNITFMGLTVDGNRRSRAPWPYPSSLDSGNFRIVNAGGNIHLIDCRCLDDMQYGVRCDGVRYQRVVHDVQLTNCHIEGADWVGVTLIQGSGIRMEGGKIIGCREAIDCEPNAHSPSSGTYLPSGENFYFHNVRVEGCGSIGSVGSSKYVPPVRQDFTNDMFMKDCHFDAGPTPYDGTVNYDGSPYVVSAMKGLTIAGVRNAVIDGCTFKRMASDQTGAGTGILYSYNSRGLKIKDCHFEDCGGNDQRAIRIKNDTENVHIDGVSIYRHGIASGNAISHGIQCLANYSIIENFFIDQVKGIPISTEGSGTEHDIIIRDGFIRGGKAGRGVRIIGQKHRVENVLVEDTNTLSSINYAFDIGGDEHIVRGCEVTHSAGPISGASTAAYRWGGTPNIRSFVDNRHSGYTTGESGAVVFERRENNEGDETTPQVIKGSGSPEGAVAAPVGSIFQRADGGASTSLYVKESGTGNTGWATATEFDLDDYSDAFQITLDADPQVQRVWVHALEIGPDGIGVLCNEDVAIVGTSDEAQLSVTGFDDQTSTISVVRDKPTGFSARSVHSTFHGGQLQRTWYAQTARHLVGAITRLRGSPLVAVITDNDTAGSGTNAEFVAHDIQALVLAATNAAVTTTVASTLSIAGPPTAGTNQTLTEALALRIKTGDLKVSAGAIRWADGVSSTEGLLTGDVIDSQDVTVLESKAVLSDPVVIRSGGVVRAWFKDKVGFGVSRTPLGTVEVRAASGDVCNLVLNQEEASAVRLRQELDSKFKIQITEDDPTASPTWETPLAIDPAANSGRGTITLPGAWNNYPLVMNGAYLWVDSNGGLRVKSSAPSGETDGVIVGTQT